MKKLVASLLLFLCSVCAQGEDVSRLIKATPYGATYTSDSVTLYTFNTANPRHPDDVLQFGTTSQGTQWYDATTSRALYRARIRDWLYICNRSTSMSLFVTVNAGYIPTLTYNETSPLNSTTDFTFELKKYGVSPYWVFVNVQDDAPVLYGGVRNVGIKPVLLDDEFATEATFRSTWMTSSTIHILGK